MMSILPRKKKSNIPHLLGYTCTICHRHFPYEEELLTCPVCGDTAILDIDYDYDIIRRHVSRESLGRDHTNSMWRYKAFLPLAERDFTSSLRVGWTPLYRSIRLEAELGLKALYIKDDGLNPTASLKDRASAVAVAKALELGYDTISCSSTGNAASSCAGNAAREGLKTVIFVPERAPQGKLAQMLAFGAHVVSVVGDYRETLIPPGRPSINTDGTTEMPASTLLWRKAKRQPRLRSPSSCISNRQTGSPCPSGTAAQSAAFTSDSAIFWRSA